MSQVAFSHMGLQHPQVTPSLVILKQEIIGQFDGATEQRLMVNSKLGYILVYFTVLY